MRDHDLFVELSALADDTVFASWRALCQTDPVLSQPPVPEPSPELMKVVLRSLEVPIEAGDVLDDAVRRNCIDLVNSGTQAGVVMRELHLLGVAIEEAMAAIDPVDVRIEVVRRSHLLIGGAMISAASAALGPLHANATRDSTTGMLNRRAFDDDAIKAFADASSATPLTIVHLDLDGLKQVNDTGGHAAGDRLIKDFALGLSDGVGEHQAYRWGGDEFAVLMPRTHLCAAVQLMTSLKARLSAFSWGAACVPYEPISSLEVLNYWADRRLYDMKHASKRLGIPLEPLPGPA